MAWCGVIRSISNTYIRALLLPLQGCVQHREVVFALLRVCERLGTDCTGWTNQSIFLTSFILNNFCENSELYFYCRSYERIVCGNLALKLAKSEQIFLMRCVQFWLENRSEGNKLRDTDANSKLILKRIAEKRLWQWKPLLKWYRILASGRISWKL
jgi:hypothetical protein